MIPGPEMKIKDIELEERKIVLAEKISRFLMTLTRNDRREVKKMMKEGLDLKEALISIGWQITQTPKSHA